MNKPELQNSLNSARWVGPDDPASDQSGLIHCIRLPPEASRERPVPIVVMLHGWGGDESVMWTFKKALPAGVAAITPRAPIALDEGQFIWYSEVAKRLHPSPEAFALAQNKLHHFLVRLPYLYPVDPARLILVGFSQGAVVGNALALSYPDILGGMASLAGAIPHVPDLVQRAGSLQDLQVFIAHGVRDAILPVSVARYAREIFVDRGATVTYGEYRAAHKMNQQAIDDLKTWLAGVLAGKSG
jgi:phospholipase/carboxylesterase